MQKKLVISGREYNFKSSAAIPRMYRIKFGRDIFVDLSKLQRQIEESEKAQEKEREMAEAEGRTLGEEESTMPIESLEMFENIAFLMHRHGDPTQPKEIEDWLDQFETFDIYQILPELLEMWGMENMQTSHSKKKNGK